MARLLRKWELPSARSVADDFCITLRGASVAEGAIHELKDELVYRNLTV